jgi:pSer/pThr/pTyr-binding forkhead associated (FHA) protein
MKRVPAIIVQLVHMQGPLKGEIQEFTESAISIGRKRSCHVCFPAKLTIISREHASIIREGNRFKLIDHSVNGTLVNGKPVKEVYLKDGDVIDFARGGPKVSFLTQVGEGEVEIAVSKPPLQPKGRGSSGPELRSTTEQDAPVEPAERVPVRPASPPSPPEQVEKVEVAVSQVQAPIVIQYGPTLQSFKQVPVTIGKNPSSDFVLDHPAIMDRHMQIFFHQNEYWVKDLTGQNLISLNQKPVDLQAPLAADDELALSPRGPFFRFLGGGRLAEIEKFPPEEFTDPGNDIHRDRAPHGEIPKEKSPKGPMSILKKILDR